MFVSGDVSLNSRLFVTSDVSLGARMFVSGDVSFNSRLFVTSDVSLGARLFVSGDVSMNSRLFISNDVSMNARLFVSGDSSMNSNLYVLGKTIQQGDVSMNSQLFVGGNLNVYGNLIYGLTPVTKFYNWTGTVAPSITMPRITLTFNNNSFYAKIHSFLYTDTNLGTSSIQIADFQGGNAAGSTPNNIDLVSKTTTLFSDCAWNIPTTTPNNIVMTTTHPNNNNIYFTLRIELIQMNQSNLRQPALTSISINTNNLGATATTVYNY